MEEFEAQLINAINNNPMPLDMKWYVCRQVFSLIDTEYKKQKALQAQMQQQQENNNEGSE